MVMMIEENQWDLVCAEEVPQKAESFGQGFLEAPLPVIFTLSKNRLIHSNKVKTVKSSQTIIPRWKVNL